MALAERLYLFQPFLAHVLALDDGGVFIEPGRTLLRCACSVGIGLISPGDQLARAVGGEELGEVPPTEKAIGGFPRFRGDSQAFEKRVQRARRFLGGEAVVYSDGIGFEQLASLGRQVSGHTLRSARPAERSHFTVVREGGFIS